MRTGYLLACITALVGLCACLAVDSKKGYPPDDMNIDAATSPDGSVDGQATAKPCSSTLPCSSGVCDEDRGECVECLLDSNCGLEMPVCGPAKTCTGCTTGQNLECARFTNMEVCGPSGACVACVTSSDCTDPGAPHCGVGNRCTACVQDADCAPFGQLCDETKHQCVQCRPDATEEAQCPDTDPSPAIDGPACDPTTKTCAGAPRGSLSTCQACISDTECTNGTKCVATVFNGSPHGHHCLLLAPQSPQVCPNRYAAKRTATSVLGVSGDYCFPDDAFTTCEAIAGFQDACTQDAECGAAGLEDGLCRSDRCTYGCDSRSDCSGSTAAVNKCIGGAQQYCDPN